MKLLKGLSFASFVSLTIMVLVSFFPQGEGWRSKGQSLEAERIEPVFKLSKPIALSKDNLVSYLKQTDVHFAFKQVELENNTLFIQMHVAATTEEGQSDIHKLMFQDVYRLLKHLYRYTTNIEQVYLRFFQQPSQRQHVHERELRIQTTPKTLLISVESKRIHFDLKQIEEQLDFEDEEKVEAFILANTKVIYGTGWKERQ